MYNVVSVLIHPSQVLLTHTRTYILQPKIYLSFNTSPHDHRRRKNMISRIRSRISQFVYHHGMMDDASREVGNDRANYCNKNDSKSF